MPRKKKGGSDDEGDGDDDVAPMSRDDMARVHRNLREVLDEDLEEIEDEEKDEVARVVSEFLDNEVKGAGRGVALAKDEDHAMPDLEGTIGVMAFFTHFVLGPPNAMPKRKPLK